jgi:hypothetical protein
MKIERDRKRDKAIDREKKGKNEIDKKMEQERKLKNER